MKKWFLPVLLLCVLVCAACGQTDEQDTSWPSGVVFADPVDDTAQSTAPQTVAAESATEAELTAAPTESGDPSKLQVQWAASVPESLAAAESRSVHTGDEAVQIFFSTNRTLRDFRVLNLELADVYDDGNFQFRCQTLQQLPELTPAHPLVIETVFYGDIPNNGVSYVDENGETQYYSVSVSGLDGALLLEPFVPA